MDFSFLKKMEPRLVYLLMTAILVLTLLAAYLYLFKEPLRAYGMLRQNRDFLSSRIEGGRPLGEDIAALEDRLRNLELQVKGDKPPLPLNKLIAHTIETLDIIAGEQQVQLTDVRPQSPAVMGEFEEIPFAVEVTGRFVDLYRWLDDVERQLGPMVVKRFEISGPEERLQMSLFLASYRLVGAMP